MVATDSTAELLCRGGVYAALSRVFLYPAATVGQQLVKGEFHRHVQRMLSGIADTAELRAQLRQAPAPRDPELDYQQLFEGGQSLGCPLGETEYTASHVWMQTQQMADIAGFYRAFGVDAQNSGERPDALSVELEFLYLLCIKEAAAQDVGDAQAASICREARAKFLTQHLLTWLPRLLSRVEQFGGTGFYAIAVRLARSFVALDAAALGLREELA